MRRPRHWDTQRTKFRWAAVFQFHSPCCEGPLRAGNGIAKHNENVEVHPENQDHTLNFYLQPQFFGQFGGIGGGVALNVSMSRPPSDPLSTIKATDVHSKKLMCTAMNLWPTPDPPPPFLFMAIAEVVQLCLTCGVSDSLWILINFMIPTDTGTVNLPQDGSFYG